EPRPVVLTERFGKPLALTLVVFDEQVQLGFRAVRLPADGGELPNVVIEGQASGLAVHEDPGAHAWASVAYSVTSPAWRASREAITRRISSVERSDRLVTSRPSTREIPA